MNTLATKNFTIQNGLHHLSTHLQTCNLQINAVSIFFAVFAAWRLKVEAKVANVSTQPTKGVYAHREVDVAAISWYFFTHRRVATNHVMKMQLFYVKHFEELKVLLVLLMCGAIQFLIVVSL